LVNGKRLMFVNQAYRYELDPTVKQQIAFDKGAGIARFVYNWGLARNKASYSGMQMWKAMYSLGLMEPPPNGGKGAFLTAYTLINQLTAIKKTEYPWIEEVSSRIPNYALQNVERAYKKFFKGRRKGVGFPKFKRKGAHDSFSLCDSIHIADGQVKLPRIGWVKTKESTHKFAGKIKMATVSREADRWYVALTVERERPDPERRVGRIIGIDLGINRFATLSNGSELEAPRPLKNSLRRLKRLSKQHSRKQNGSKNKKKSALRLARLHRKVKNQRRDFLHKETTKLAKTKPVIYLKIVRKETYHHWMVFQQIAIFH